MIYYFFEIRLKEKKEWERRDIFHHFAHVSYEKLQMS